MCRLHCTHASEQCVLKIEITVLLAARKKKSLHLHLIDIQQLFSLWPTDILFAILLHHKGMYCN